MTLRLSPCPTCGRTERPDTLLLIAVTIWALLLAVQIALSIYREIWAPLECVT